MACKSQKIVGRTVAIEFHIGCGNVLPLESEWKRLGPMRAKEFNTEWDTVDATADDSQGSFREEIASYQSASISGDGVLKLSGEGAANMAELFKHVLRPDATEGQPVAWVRITFPDLTFTFFAIISNMSRSAPHDDLVTFSLEASATSSDFGVIVEDTPDANSPDVTSIEALPSTLQIAMGDSFALKAIANPPQADQRVRWSSANPLIASVNQLTGTVVGVGLGNVNVTAESVDDPGMTDVVAVTIVSPAQSVQVAPASVTVAVGDDEQLTAGVLPGTAPQGVTYVSSDSAVATVSNTGLIEGVAVGSAVVTVRSTFNPATFYNVPVTVTA